MLHSYLKHFSNLHSNKLKGMTAPHKAIMLISVIDMIANGKISSNQIELTEELEECFLRNWNHFVKDDSIFKPKAGTPFWHLHYEPFWKLVPFSGGEEIISQLKKSNPYSPGTIRKYIRHAEIDIELFELLKNEEYRNVLREVLVKSVII